MTTGREQDLIYVGSGAASRQLDREIDMAARSDAKVLITGETGVGKDVVARLKGLIAQHDRESVKPAWPSLIRTPIAIDRPLGTKPRAGETYIYWSN